MTDQNEFSRQPEWLAQTFEAKRAHLRAVLWLTTVVAHICLDVLRSRTAKREEA